MIDDLKRKLKEFQQIEKISNIDDAIDFFVDRGIIDETKSNFREQNIILSLFGS